MQPLTALNVGTIEQASVWTTRSSAGCGHSPMKSQAVQATLTPSQ